MSRVSFLTKLALSISGFLLLSSCESFLENLIKGDESNEIADAEDISYINMENYPEWECGIVDANESYLFLKQDPDTNGYVAYFNSNQIESDGIIFYFDDNLKIQSFATEKGLCNILWTDDNTADIHIISDEIDKYVTNVNIEYPQDVIETRVAWIPVMIWAARGISAILTLNDVKELINNLMDGDWKSAGLNLAEIILMGKPPKIFKDFIVDITYEIIKQQNEYFKNRGIRTLLGDCEISITHEKVGVNVYNITLSVAKHETIPTEYKELCIYAGVAVRKDFPHITYSNNDDIIGEFKVVGNCTKTITYELPKNSSYYAIPYLLPTRAGKDCFTQYARYGNSIRLEYFKGDIDSFSQQSYTRQDQIITFNCTAHATCYVDDNERWLLFYENDLGNKTYYYPRTYDEPSITDSNTEYFDFQVDLHVSNFVNGENKIKLGIFIFDENNYSISSEPEIYTLSYSPVTLNSISYENDYYYFDDDGVNGVGYNCTANISGNTMAIENLSSCGIYFHNYDTGVNYKLGEENLYGNYNNENIDLYFGVLISDFDKLDYKNYYAEANKYGFGVYIEFNDGTYYLSEPKACKFIYDRKPSYKYLSVGPMNVDETGSFEDDNGELVIKYQAKCVYSYAVNGVLWIEYIQGLIEGGTWVFTNTGTKQSNPWKPNWDNEYESDKVYYYNSNFDMYHTEYRKIVTKSGETIYSNSLIHGGTPENPTVSIGGVMTSSIMGKHNCGIFSGRADTAYCGYSDGVAISDIEINRSKVMTVDNLKEIPMDKIVHLSTTN